MPPSMETENPQPAKRPRTDEGAIGNDDSSLNVLSQHPQFWFEDGNVVLQAESMQFKVHRSVLSSQSQVFKDMFSVPQPPRSSPAAESSIVVLHDSTEDVENIVALLYDTMRVYNLREKMSLSVLGSMLRLGRKYRFKHLITEALHCLKLEFPLDFTLWDAREGGKYIKDTENSLFDALYIAHEHSIKSILPSIYVMICSRYSVPTIIAGFDRPTKQLFLKTGEPLSCLQGREKLFRSVSQNTMAWVKQDIVPCSDCTQRATCAKLNIELMKNILNAEIFKVIWLVAYSWRKNNLHHAFCTPCGIIAQQAFDVARRVVWNQVPDYFGLKDEDFDAPWHNETEP